MIKLIVFDLDGVLIDSKQTHYEALNRALGQDFAISIDEHLAKTKDSQLINMPILPEQNKNTQ